MPDSLTLTLPAAALAEAAAAVERHLGIRFEADRRDELWRGISQASIELNFGSPEELAWLLAGGRPDAAVIDAVAGHLTVGETYFFREAAGLDLLRDHLRAELALADPQGGPPRRLALWSAGCCTGEEAYTLSILAETVLAGHPEAAVDVLATDVNRRFLDYARRGIYRAWSFRGMHDDIRARYFTARPDQHFEIDAGIRRRVTFMHANLIDAGAPGPQADGSLDGVVCRNVLMYFSPAQARATVRRLHQALKPGGLLVVGAVDATMPIFDGFSPVLTSEAVAFRKPRLPAAAEEGPAADAPASPRARAVDRYRHKAPRHSAAARAPVPRQNSSLPAAGAHPYERALDLFRQGRASSALALAVREAARPHGDKRCRALAARIEANQGNLDAALRWATGAVEADSRNPEFAYLYATISYEAGRLDEAEHVLARIIGFSPGFAMAHYTLGLIARSRHDTAAMQTHLRNALLSLESQAPGDCISEGDGLTAGALRQVLMKLLGMAP